MRISRGVGLPGFELPLKDLFVRAEPFGLQTSLFTPKRQRATFLVATCFLAQQQ